MSDQSIPRDLSGRNGLFRLEPLKAAARENLLATICLSYFAVGGLFLAAMGANPLEPLLYVPGSFQLFLQLASNLLPLWAYAVMLIPIVALPSLRRRIWTRKLEILAAIVYCTLFMMVFGSVKNSLPGLVPFWADPMFTRLDELLHFGQTPHALLGWLSKMNIQTLSGVYLNTWVFPATYLPMLLLIFDGNAERRRQFVLLWACTWIVLGNVIALVFMSTGPIFQDLLPGGVPQAHESALAMLERADASGLMRIKMHLWTSYTGESGLIGSGISAFPSVHVGMAAVFGLYIGRIGRDLSLHCPAGRARHALRLAATMSGLAIVGIFLVLSVYLGWHFAVDGYASIAVIVAIYFLLISQEGDQTPERSSLAAG